MEDYNVKKFVSFYIDAVFEFLSETRSPRLKDFDAEVRRRVAKKTGLTEEGVKYLHHSLHWELFLYGRSPLRIRDSDTINGGLWVETKNPLPEKQSLVDLVLRNHWPLLVKRMESLSRV